MTRAPEQRTGLVQIDRERLRFRVDRRTYSDPEVFRRERDTLFRRCWLYAGHGSGFLQEGDFFTRTIGGFGLILGRGSGGRVGRFYKRCSLWGARVSPGTRA